jgi:hypothetical protein
MMTTMLPALIDHEDAAETAAFANMGPPSAPPRNACLISRIGWCHRQALKARTPADAKKWWAETQGLIDALLCRDSTFQYEGMPLLGERYASGLKDGEMMIQAASCHHRYRSWSS